MTTSGQIYRSDTEGGSDSQSLSVPGQDCKPCLKLVSGNNDKDTSVFTQTHEQILTFTLLKKGNLDIHFGKLMGTSDSTLFKKKRNKYKESPSTLNETYATQSKKRRGRRASPSKLHTMSHHSTTTTRGTLQKRTKESATDSWTTFARLVPNYCHYTLFFIPVCACALMHS